MIFPDASSTAGKTMVELGRIGQGLPGRIVAKLEMRNPGGSVKDRVGVALIDDAEARGILLTKATERGTPKPPGERLRADAGAPSRTNTARS